MFGRKKKFDESEDMELLSGEAGSTEPSERSLLDEWEDDQEAQEEEERRLFYVGMTRARDELILTTSGEPSCFLKDLSGQWLCRQEAEEGRGQKPRQMSLFDFL